MASRRNTGWKWIQPEFANMVAIDASLFCGLPNGYLDLDGIVPEMNNELGMTIGDINCMLNTENIPNPNTKPLFIMAWTILQKSFLQGSAHVWDVKTEHTHLIVVTLTDLMPLVPGAQGLGYLEEQFLYSETGIRLFKMLHLKDIPIVNSLAVLMESCDEYWVITAFLRHDAAKACPNPTSKMHPEIIIKLGTLYTKLRSARILKELKRPQPKAPSRIIVSVVQKRARLLPFVDPSVPAAPAVLGSPKTHITCEDICLDLALFNIKHSNVAFRKLCMNDFDDLYTPEAGSADHSWVVMHLGNDCTHILLPDFGVVEAVERIRRTQAVASEMQMSISFEYDEDPGYGVLVTPLSQTKLYFGPLREGMELPVIILLQHVDGRMMRREQYQQEFKIIPKPEDITSAFMVRQKNHRVLIHMQSNNNIGKTPNNVIEIKNEGDEVLAPECTNAARGELQQQLVTSSNPVPIGSPIEVSSTSEYRTICNALNASSQRKRGRPFGSRNKIYTKATTGPHQQPATNM